jgi:hypothetical protein
VVSATGAKAARGIVVQVTDEIGRPVEGAAVSFRLPEEGPGGTFGHGMRTDISVTGADGRAAVHDLQWNRIEGPFQIRVTAVRGELRAGTIVNHYLAQKTGSSGPTANLAAKSGSKRKWLVIAAVAAGGAAAGLALGRGSGPAPVGGATTAPPSAPQIGAPTITIGKP